MKGLLVALALLITACSGPYLFDDDDRDSALTKKEMELWQVLQRKEAGKMDIHHEDRWYKYDVKLEGVKRTQFTNVVTSAMSSMCPIGKAEYTVTDRKTSEVLRKETLFQTPCAPCHKR